MSGVYPYCVVPLRHSPPRELTGLNGHPVHGLEVGGFMVWISDERSTPSVDLEHVKRHHSVVEKAFASSATVPVRYGAWAPHRDALVGRMIEKEDAIGCALRRLSGRVEFSVSVLESTQEEAEGMPGKTRDATMDSVDGRGYLRELSRSNATRRRRRHRTERVASRLRQHVGGLPCEEQVRTMRPPGLLSVAHLVRRRKVPAYRNAVELFVHDEAGVDRRVYVTGPWPPYSFTPP